MKVSFKKMQLVEKKYAVFTLIGRNLELLRNDWNKAPLAYFGETIDFAY